MTWLLWLAVAVVVTAVFSVIGLQPKGTRPVEYTRMLGIGRLVLVAIIIVLAYAAFRARAGG